ncbi:MAG: chondroitinase-B domain-containing protein [Ignavibacteria bacterium]|nr:chondroitinase-B domain-containing protein [Ignavibacteria bacterium]
MIVMLATTALNLQATEIHVSSVAALQSAINGASAGDVILLDNGTYLNNVVTIGTSDITVKAATLGGVYLNGTNEINISGSNVIFSGFQFTAGSIDGIVIIVSGNHVILTQLNFKGYSAQKYVNLQGQYDEVSFCNFENKPTTAPQGNLIHIAPNGSVPNYAKIRYCSFLNMPGAGGDNGNECIRIANGAQSTYLCRTVVEYCYFENTGMGDSEAISVKSRENVLRYNTFRNNQNAMMVFRNGDDNIGYGNFFIGAGGIRVKEANNIYCYNNYFENSGVGGNSDAVTYVYYTANTTNVLKNINFIHNTFVDCGMIDFDKGAANNTWANNIFKKSTGNIFTASSASGISWAGNICTGTLGFSIASGMTNADPKLTKNSDGYIGLSSSSPAIDASSANYPPILDIANINDDPGLLLDISGQSRPTTLTLKDVGCDEYNTTSTVTNRPLTLSDVGPSYLGGPATSVTNDQDRTAPGATPSGVQLDEAYPNPFNPTTTIHFHIPATAHVSLKVYDQLGREATALIDGIRQAGSHQILWNASQYPSGVYLCRLQIEQRIETIKLLLLK